MSVFHCPMRKNILFDLDGTLLPMDMDVYLKLYIDGLSRQIPDIPPQEMFKVLWEGIIAMMKNDGGVTNREAFAQVFTARTGMDYYANEEKFLRFYETDYHACAASATQAKEAARIIRALQEKGYHVIIATSPLYPVIATQARLKWAGLEDFDFPMVTTFDDFHYAKPNPKYYLEICQKLGVQPEECIMVGNDVEEDGVAASIGMDMVLVTDCVINKKNLPAEDFHCATLGEVLAWAEDAPRCE